VRIGACDLPTASARMGAGRSAHLLAGARISARPRAQKAISLPQIRVRSPLASRLCPCALFCLCLLRVVPPPPFFCFCRLRLGAPSISTTSGVACVPKGNNRAARRRIPMKLKDLAICVSHIILNLDWPQLARGLTMEQPSCSGKGKQQRQEGTMRIEEVQSRRSFRTFRGTGAPQNGRSETQHRPFKEGGVGH
jgi:hypothetical protein